jgi:hypothetical protein
MNAITLDFKQQEDRPAWGRGVLALYEHMTGRRSDDVVKTSRITLRDFIIAAISISGMWGLQVATSTRTTAAIEQLGMKLDGYIQKQAEHNIEMQRQVDEVRRQANLGVVLANEAKTEAAKLEGMFIGIQQQKGDRK